MTNETTASQPKSIGDDAQFIRLLNEWHWSEDDAAVKKAYEAIVSFIEADAPAVQASATIQAAPEDYVLVPRKITPAMIEGGITAHYGKRRVASVGGATGVSMTVNGTDYSGVEAMRNFWKGAIAAAPAATIQAPVMVAEPVEMILHCPTCRVQHVDAPDDRTPDWTNPPHRSHLCHACGFVWRPADVPTSGVAAIKTIGKADTAPMVADPAGVAVKLLQELRYLDDHCEIAPVDELSKDFVWLTERITKFLDGAATVKAVPSEALDDGPFTLEQRMPPKDVEVLIYWPCSDGTFACAVDEWSDLHEDPIGMGGPTICVGEGWLRHEADVTYWAPIPAVKIAAPLADKTGGGE